MKKYFFIAPWNIEKVEQKLCAMEQEGHQLVGVQFPHRFIFAEGSPRNVRYVFLYSELKEYGLLRWRSVFLSDEFHGNELQNTKLSFYRLIRIKKIGSPAQMNSFLAERRSYIYRIYRNRFWASITALGFFTALLAYNYYNTALFLAILLLFVVIAGYHLYGMIALRSIK